MADHSVGEANPHLLQPDTMLPSQYYAAAMRRKGALKPERRLIIAVLQDAIECYQKNLFSRDGKGRQLYADAAEWIDSEDRTHYFSYENICAILDMNPEFVRRGLHDWRQRQLNSQGNSQGRALGKVLSMNTRPGQRQTDEAPLRRAAH